MSTSNRTSKGKNIYRLLFENTTDMIWILEEDVFVDVNPAVANTLGYSDPSEIVGLKPWDISPDTQPDGIPSSDKAETLIRKALTEGMQTFEWVHTRKDGTPVYCRISLIAHTLQDKTVILAIGRDVSKQQQTETALRESKQMLRLVIDSLPVGVFWKDRNSIYRGCNVFFANSAGLRSPEEIIGKSDFDLPWKEREAEAYRIDDREVMDTGIPKLYYEETQYTADGRLASVRTSKMPLRDAEGSVIGVLGTFEDFTKQKEAEVEMQMYRDIVQNMQVGLYVYQLEDLEDDRTLRLTAANPASSTGMGLDSDEIIGKYIDEVFPALRRQGIPREFANVVRTQKPFIVEDFTYSDARLVRRHYAFRVFPIPGNKVGVLFEDTTLEKQAEEEKNVFYRETISSVTEGKLVVTDKTVAARYALDSDMRFALKSYSDTSELRKCIIDYCREKGISDDDLTLFAVALGEAMANAVKHAGGGEVFVGSRADEVWVGVSDTGPGIPALTLPKATLSRGFSTKISMGMGYSLMLNAADEIMLSTDPGGTTVIQFKILGAKKPVASLDDIPDTWDSVQ